MSAALCSLYDVMASKPPKGKILNVRVSPQERAEFKIACDLQGTTMSNAILRFIYRTIREEKAKEPEMFTEEAVNERILADEAEEFSRKGRFRSTELLQGPEMSGQENIVERKLPNVHDLNKGEHGLRYGEPDLYGNPDLTNKEPVADNNAPRAKGTSVERAKEKKRKVG